MGDRYVALIDRCLPPIDRRLRRWASAVAAVVAVLCGAARVEGDASSVKAFGEPAILWARPGQGHGTPVVDDDQVYFLSRQRELVALSLPDGRERWRRAVGNTGPQTGGGTLAAAAGVVVVGHEEVWGYDRITGAARWRFAPASIAAPGAYLGAAARGLVYSGSANGHVVAIGLADGRTHWSRYLGPRALVFAPVFDEERGVVMAGYLERGPPSRGGIAAFDAATGRERWRHHLLPMSSLTLGGGASGAPLSCADSVVAASRDGTVHVVDGASGRLGWVIPAIDGRLDHGEVPSQDLRPLACAGTTVIVGSLTGAVRAYDVLTHRERWRASPVAASVAFDMTADGATVYIPFLSGELVALAADTGVERWRVGGRAAAFFWPPAVYHARLFAAGVGAGFVAFGL